MDNDKNTQLLLTLISSLASQAWIQMGKIKNPVTDEVERNIDAASVTIDMLTMLKDKTSKNISDDEKNFIDHTLRDLQMNFIAEKNKDDSKTDSNDDEKIKKDSNKKTKKSKTK
tara:strand:- start:676 stop:1017 length:342 start_codon:yes stop_codon:yes gene_type:complete